MRRLSLVVGTLCAVGCLQAQVSGPSEGLIFDLPEKCFRAVLGTLGSSTLGPALTDAFEFGSVAPRKTYAVAFRDGRYSIVAGLGTGAVTVTELNGDPLPAPEGAVWSDDGSVALLFSRSGNWIQAVRNVAESPALDPPVDVSLTGGSLSALAVSARNSRIAIGTAGDAAGIYELSSGNSLVPLPVQALPLALAFGADDQSLYILDANGNQATAVTLADFTSSSWTLDGLEDPVAIRWARTVEGQAVVYVAGKREPTLATYNAETHELLFKTPLPSAPAAIEPLGRNSYLLGPRLSAQDPLWSFIGLHEPAIRFIPAAPLPTGEESGQ